MNLGGSCRSGMTRPDREDPDYEGKERTIVAVHAANILVQLKQKSLSLETARNLEAMKRQFLLPVWLPSHAGTKRRAQRTQESKAPNKVREAVCGVAAQEQSLPGESQLQTNEGLFYGNYAPPDVPPVPSLRGLIQVCSKPFEKQLTSSDVRDDQSRLSMNKDDVENHIFPLLNDDEDPIKGIHVTTYDMDGREYPMVFKTWVSKIHVLTGGWKSFCHDRELVQKQDFVTLWVFRNVDNGRLCFVINSRRFPVYETIKKRRLTQN